jgi:hypothetical protein
MAFSTGIGLEEEQGRNLEEIAGRSSSDAVQRIVENSPEWKEHKKKHPDARLRMDGTDDKQDLNKVADFRYDPNNGQKSGHDTSYGHTQTFGGSCSCGEEIKMKGTQVYLIGENKEKDLLQANGLYASKTSSNATTTYASLSGKLSELPKGKYVR